MPKFINQPSDVNSFVDWLYGHECDSDPAIAALATHVQLHVTRRPAAGGSARWPSISAMRYAVSVTGPVVPAMQFDAALAVYLNS